jgi:predicted nucleotidyltransferase
VKALESIGDREASGELFAEHGIILAYLFGSQAEEEAGPLSDVDIAVKLGPMLSATHGPTCRLS